MLINRNRLLPSKAVCLAIRLVGRLHKIFKYRWMPARMQPSDEGDLTAHLTVTVTDFPIKTLSDLANQNQIKPVVNDGTNLYTLLAEAKSGVYKQIFEKMLIIAANDDCPRKPERTNEACINDYTTALDITMNNCSKFYLAKELFNTATVAFMYPRDAYYANLFDFHMQQLHETGVMQRLFNVYWSSDHECGSAISATDADTIGMEGIAGCFIVTGCLYAIGLLILLMELVWTRLCNKTPIECLLY